MSRRRVVATFFALLAVAGSAVSQPTSAADDVAAVNGESISGDDVTDIIDALVGSDIGWVVDPANDTIAGDQARLVVATLITNELGVQFAEQYDIDESADFDRDSASEVLDGEGGASLTGAAREMVIDQIYRSEQRASSSMSFDAGSHGEQYNRDPISLGVVCARLMTFPDEGHANDAADALRAGASAEDASAEFGAEAGTTDVQCLSVVELTQFSPALLAGFADASGGSVFDPLPGSSGFQVVQVPTFDDVVTPLQNFFDNPVASASGETPSAAQLLFDGYMISADVTVNARYGRWDPLTGSVVALGQP